jgi:flavin reductase (DIM6/NTAB) family NADH-FMN oxidoreductase RutF
MYISFTCGTGKDTYNNILATGEFTVNVVPFEQDHAGQDPGMRPAVQRQRERAGQGRAHPLPRANCRPPRIAECRSHFECKVEWTQQWLHRLMVCGRVEAVSIDTDCITDNGFIVWDKVKPAHYCGMRYRDRFVPAYDKPTRGVWRYEGRDGEFREGENWRDAYKSKD